MLASVSVTCPESSLYPYCMHSKIGKVVGHSGRPHVVPVLKQNDRHPEQVLSKSEKAFTESTSWPFR